MSGPGVVPIPRSSAYPFPDTGVARNIDGIANYDDLPPSLVAMLRARVDEKPDAEALVELGGRRLTYRGLWTAAGRVAGGLRAQGVARGDRVAIRYAAGVDWTLAFWGTILAGGIAVAVNIRFAAPELEFVLADSGAKIDLAPGVALPDGPAVEPEQALATDVAALFYTSGTTGRPKGVPTTHQAFLTNARNMAVALDVTPEHGEGLRTLISVPLFHVPGATRNCSSRRTWAALP